jgi:hypothetical protein
MTKIGFEVKTTAAKIKDVPRNSTRAGVYIYIRE